MISFFYFIYMIGVHTMLSHPKEYTCMAMHRHMRGRWPVHELVQCSTVAPCNRVGRHGHRLQRSHLVVTGGIVRACAGVSGDGPRDSELRGTWHDEVETSGVMESSMSSSLALARRRR